MDRADRDDDVRAVVFTGAGRGFCAGPTCRAAPTPSMPRIAARSIPAWTAIATAAACSPCASTNSLKPTIAACNGPAVGVGITMQLAMDVRLASEAARYGFVFTRRAIVMEACSSWFLPRLVGPQQALEWVMTGRVFPADEALQGRLVRSVHKPDELLTDRTRSARLIRDSIGLLCLEVVRRRPARARRRHPPLPRVARGPGADLGEGADADAARDGARRPAGAPRPRRGAAAGRVRALPARRHDGPAAEGAGSWSLTHGKRVEEARDRFDARAAARVAPPDARIRRISSGIDSRHPLAG